MRRARRLVWGLIGLLLLCAVWVAVALAAPRLGVFLFEVALCSTSWEGHSCAPMWSSLGLI